jgi:PAS domain S-box-containing protein
MSQKGIPVGIPLPNFKDFSDHAFFCLLYEELLQRDQAVAAFFRTAVAHNAKMICLCADEQREKMRVALQQHASFVQRGSRGMKELSVEQLEDAGRLMFVASAPFFAGNPVASAQSVADWLHGIKADAQAQGFAGLWVVLEMDGVLVGKEEDWFGECIFRLDKLSLEGDLFLLSTFNRKNLPARIILEALRLYPAIVYDNQILRNAYYQLLKPAMPKPGVAGVAERLLQRMKLLGRAKKKEQFQPYRRDQILDAIFKAAPIGLWLLDNKHRMVFTNQNFCKATGVSADCFLQAGHYSEIMKPEEVVKCMISDTLAFNADGPIQCEEALTYADGSLHTYQIVKTKVLSAEKQSTGLLGLAIDITDRKQAEERVRRQSALLKGINRVFVETLTCKTEEELGAACLQVAEELTQSQFGFVGLLNARGCLDTVAISDPGWAACRMEDKSRHRKLVTDMKVHGIYGRVLLDGKGFFTNDPASHLDSIGLPEGHPPLTAFLGVPLLQGEKTIGMVGLGNREAGYREEDLEALQALSGAMVQAFRHKKMEHTLRESEGRFREMTDGLPLIVWVYNAEGRQEFVNQTFLDYFGVTRKETTTDSWQKLAHPEDRTVYLEKLLACINDRRPFHGEVRVRRSDGQWSWLESWGRPRFGKGGEFFGYVGTSVDITERKQSREALNKAKEAAEEASRAKSEFLANTSHEIRTPMTVFLLALEHLLQVDKDPERRLLLEVADNSAKRLRALIDDILDFSRIEAQRVALEEEPFDLRACLREAVDMFILAVREKNLRLVTDVAPEVPPIVIGDSARLGQVLTNLIGNAVKFTHQGEISITVQPRDDLLEFSVSDTGIGIPEEKCEQVFESFSQADGSLTRRYGGTGLGLAICRRLVELMGGEIFARSRKDVGSIFTFTFPLKTFVRQGSRPAAAVPQVSCEEKSAARILLVDDEPMVRELVAMMLTQRGWYAEVAESGRKALKKWESGHFDVILMDLQMPEMNGLEATQAIRKREPDRGQRASIIALTAHAQSEVRANCIKAGMDMVLVKPIKSKDLYAAIENCLKK